MSELITLMYHSIYSTESEFNDIDEEDRPYALHVNDFEKHILWLVKAKYSVINPDEMIKLSSNDSIKNILITFDDGHIGFHRYAFPLLVKYNLSAIFFVTTDFIGRRKGFCNWNQLNEMSGHKMFIQSHGKTHKFLSDMSESEMREELQVSKNEIEMNTKSKVWSISFPGGRYVDSTLSIASDCGYTHCFTSEAVKIKIDSISEGRIGRFAIKKDTNEADLYQFIDPSISTIVKRNLIVFIKSFLKRFLGNYGYHKLYKIMNRVK